MPTSLMTFIVASPHLPTVGEAVRSVLGQDRADLVGEILVGGRDVHGVLPDHSLVRTLDQLEVGPACFAYNEGLRQARFDAVVIMDADCLLAPDWITRVQRRHTEGWHVVSGGLVIVPASYLALAYNYTWFHELLSTLPSGPHLYLPTMNLSFRRSVVEHVGWFREDMPRVYDIEWTLRLTRAGIRLFFDSDAHVTHHPCLVTPQILWRTAYVDGNWSQAVRREYADLISEVAILNRPRWLRLLSPCMAGWVTARILAGRPSDARLWLVAPVIWMTKLAWCLGASAGRERRLVQVEDYRLRVPKKP